MLHLKMSQNIWRRSPCRAGGKCYGFIDREGNYKIQPQFNFASSFDESGLASVGVDNGQQTEDSFWGYKWGYINANGEYVLKPIYDYASAFVDGVAYVKRMVKNFISIRRESEYSKDWNMKRLVILLMEWRRLK